MRTVTVMGTTATAGAQRKIALEEHFLTASFPGEVPDYVNPVAMTGISARLTDLADARLAEMDAAGIGVSVLSLVAPGVQAETGARHAAGQARRVNDGSTGRRWDPASEPPSRSAMPRGCCG
jgi:hypothetical protein